MHKDNDTIHAFVVYVIRRAAPNGDVSYWSGQGWTGDLIYARLSPALSAMQEAACRLSEVNKEYPDAFQVVPLHVEVPRPLRPIFTFIRGAFRP